MSINPITSTQIMMIKVENWNPVCVYCGISFNRNSELASHIAGAHFDNVFHCDVCDSVRYETKEEFTMHMKTHPSTNSVEDETEFNPMPLLVELNESSDSQSFDLKEEKSNNFPCQICGKSFTRQLDLKLHVKTHQWSAVKSTGRKTVFRHSCNVCGRTFRRIYDLSRHSKKMHHIEVDDTNVTDNAKFKPAELLAKNNDSHIEEGTKKISFPCPVCSHDFTRSFDLKRHIKTVHPHSMNIDYRQSINASVPHVQQIQPSSKQIQKIQPTEQSVLQIQNNSLTQPNVVFILPASTRLGANTSLVSESSVRKEEILTVQQEHSCFICKKIFINKSDMVSHQEAHSSEEVAQARAETTRLLQEEELIEKAEVVINGRIEYRCAHCNRLIVQRRSFIEHLRIHSGLKPYTCHVCGKQFRIWNLLNRHIQDVHEGLKRYPCDICGRKFANSSARDDHRRIHTGERPFICHICGKAFKSKSCLFTHNRFHSNNLPHKCTFCEKRYRTRQQLKEHITLHTGEKPNVCNMCGKAFRLNSCLRRHKQNHDRKEKVECEICGKWFPQMRYLKLHLRSHNLRTSISMNSS